MEGVILYARKASLTMSATVADEAVATSMAGRCGSLANEARLVFGPHILLELFPACIYSSKRYGLAWVGLSIMCPADAEYADSRLRSISRFTLRPGVHYRLARRLIRDIRYSSQGYLASVCAVRIIHRRVDHLLPASISRSASKDSAPDARSDRYQIPREPS